MFLLLIGGRYKEMHGLDGVSPYRDLTTSRWHRQANWGRDGDEDDDEDEDDEDGRVPQLETSNLKL